MQLKTITDVALLKILIQNGYNVIVEIPTRGVCAVIRMAFTTALCYGLDKTSYKGRYCYETMAEAIGALINWDGAGDPPGDWIKHKGGLEYSNPNYKKE